MANKPQPKVSYMVIEKLKDQYRLDTKHLCEALDTTNVTLSNWKSQGHLPLKQSLKLIRAVNAGQFDIVTASTITLDSLAK